MRRSLREQYPKYSEERLDKIAAGIWHKKSEKEKERLTRKLEKSAHIKGAVIKILKALKDFGAWTSHNFDSQRDEGPRTVIASVKEPVVVKRYAVFMPIHVAELTAIAAKSVGAQPGDLVVEGHVSLPIKDLQGDVLELPALITAKNEMTRPPHNLAWLDHESPYAKPQENQSTPPIGKFVAAKILKVAGQPALWVRMIVNKAHPLFEKVAYELKNGFYNAFSMEFVAVKEGLKQVGGKLVNAISDIKYFATCLVRAPANEGATISRVYMKAFANTHSEFCPVRVNGSGWIGQSIKQKGVGKLENKQLEPEKKPEEEEKDEEEEPLAILKDHAQRLETLEKYAKATGSILKTIAANTAIMGKSMGLDLKGIDEDTLECLGEEEGPGLAGEQEFPELEYGEAGKPKPQRIITTFEGPDLPGEEVEDQAIDVKALGRFIVKTVREAVSKEIDKKTVVRKGFAEHAGPVPESIRRLKEIEKDDGSIESQLAITMGE